MRRLGRQIMAWISLKNITFTYEILKQKKSKKDKLIR